MTLSMNRARSSVAFDWLMAGLTVLVMGGILLDGWAHSHGEVDQSFLTPWHGLLYGSMALTGIVLAIAALRNLLRAGGVSNLVDFRRWRNALPPGYWGAAIGVLIFVVGGAFDAFWHTVFGIETGISLLISPSHLLLAFAMALIASGPLCSVATQYDRNTGGWRRVGPAVLATWALLTLVGFFLAYAQPIEDSFTPVTIQTGANDTAYPSIYAVDPQGHFARVPLAFHTLLSAVSVSPDDKRIAYRVNHFQSDSAQPPSDLYVASASGARPARITNSSRHDTLPQWSPDGRSIAYVSMPAGTSGDFAIHIVRPNGAGDHTLITGPTTIDAIAWSPDGKHIAYASRNGTTAMIALADVASGKTAWLPFTANGSSPAWQGERLAYVLADGSVRSSALDGRNERTIAAAGSDAPIWSRDGRKLAFIARDGADSQAFVADANGAHPRNVSLLSGLNVTSLAWAPDGRLYFTAVGRRDPVHTGLGFSLAQAALLLQAVVVTAAILLLVRRWRMPFGGTTLLLTAFALAMAVQSDYYFYAISALITGVTADAALGLWGDRLRAGRGFYAFGFLVPAVFNALYLVVTVRAGGGTSAWPWNLLLGAPLLGGAVGLLLAFCFDSPLDPHRGAAPAIAVSTDPT